MQMDNIISKTDNSVEKKWVIHYKNHQEAFPKMTGKQKKQFSRKCCFKIENRYVSDIKEQIFGIICNSVEAILQFRRP